MNLLHYHIQGEGEPFVILHGLFGSSKNWQHIMTSLSSDYKVIGIDLRNHGQSFHAPNMSYQVMAYDVLAVLNELGLDSVTLIGHSMGGKVAMVFALLFPDRVKNLIVVDIAPITYEPKHLSIFEALLNLPVPILSRDQADRHLSSSLPNRALRQFLLKNLKRHDSAFIWSVPLPFLHESYDLIRGFPEIEGKYIGPVSVIYGQDSDYVLEDYHSSFNLYFSSVSLCPIAQAGHWLHAEQPVRFLEMLSASC